MSSSHPSPQNIVMETEKTRETTTSPPLQSQPPVPPPSPPRPPSLSSSPAHEFTFTISLHPPSPLSYTTRAALKLAKPSLPAQDIDLSPADEIFFHGHLLPLHISHRHSNNSIETEKKSASNSANESNPATVAAPAGVRNEDYKDRPKPKSFSSIFAVRKWLRGTENSESEKQRNAKKKKMLHIGRLWRKYATLVEPFLFFKSSKEKREVRRCSYSFSGVSNPREGGWRRRWRGEFSAPASMRTSPANSGLLVAPSSAFSSSDESTMEELQNAIQAAIAHCKNSIAAKEENCD